MNPGNSGGPAFVGDQLVGLSMSIRSNAENIGYIIPCEEIARFIEDVEDGEYSGKRRLSYQYSTLQNQNLRDKLQLENDMGGLLVAGSPDFRNRDEGMRKMDVLLEIGGQKIDRTGKVKIRDDLRLSFNYLIPHLEADGYLPVTLLRNGKLLETKVKLASDQNIVMPFIGQKQPPYFIYGPIAFSIANQEFLSAINKKSRENLANAGSEVLYRRYDYAQQEGEEVITCTRKFFPHQMIKGYSDPQLSVLKTVNGIEILNMQQLVEQLSELKRDDFVTFEFAWVNKRRPLIIILRHGEVLDAMEDILDDNGIRLAYSKEFRDLWTEY